MKISLNWLKEYVAVKLKPEDLAHKLTMAGLEVERISFVDGDTIFELEITPNRPDCLNFLGIAREVSAIFNIPLKFPKVDRLKFPNKKCPVLIGDRKGCGRYRGTIIRDVKVSESPVWLKKYLSAVGVRSINNVVDVTNFVLLETGQPLHAFDYDKLDGGRIIVRRAQESERLLALDEKEYILDPSFLVIADAKSPVALAGIIGGLATSVTSSTKNVLLESASFDPVLIRRAARKLGISTDSSYRFERGVNASHVDTWSDRAVTLIIKLASGFIDASNDAWVKREDHSKISISVSLSEVHETLGAHIPKLTCERILKRLGCRLKGRGKNVLLVDPPTSRRDLKTRVDIIEELARGVGYDQLPTSLPHVRMSNIPAPKNLIYKNLMGDILTAQGLNEIITMTMVSRKVLEKSGLKDTKTVSVKNPLSIEQELMRPSLLPSFLSVLALNLNRGERNMALFENGKVYLADGEKDVLGLALSGTRPHDWRHRGKVERDFFELKGCVQALLDRMFVKNYRFVLSAESIFEPQRQLNLLINETLAGRLGVVSKDILDQWDIKRGNIFFAEIDSEALFANVSDRIKFQPLSEFPAVSRDISLLVKRDISYAKVRDVILNSKADHLISVDFLEEYRDDKMANDARSLTCSLKYQSSHKTLSDEEVNRSHDRVRLRLAEELRATFR